MRFEIATEVQTKIDRIMLNRERGLITAREMFFQLMDSFLMISTEGWGDTGSCRFHQSVEKVCFIMLEHRPLDIYIEDEELRIVL